MLLFDMKIWVLSICSVALLTTIGSMILPEGKMKKPVEGIFALIISIAIVSPILSLDLSNFNINLGQDEEVFFQENFLSYVDEKRGVLVENECVSILENLGINNASVSINNYQNSDDEIMVFVNLENVVINSKNEHIDIIEQARYNIANHLNINVNCVVVQT